MNIFAVLGKHKNFHNILSHKNNSSWTENHKESESDPSLCHKFAFKTCTIANLTIQFLSLVVTIDRATYLVKMEGDHPDTVPGFTMQSQNFVLKFVTGLQKGGVSKLLEMETDWSVCDHSDVDVDVDVDQV